MRSIRRIAAITALLPISLHAQAGQVVGPNGTSTLGNPTNWTPNIQAGATAQVTANNPRIGFGGYGSGSLELSVTGQISQANGQYPDWGFYYQYASSPNGYGSLSRLSSLSFDWYREALADWNTTSPSIDWPYKTPVMRLVLQDKNNNLSELIWEGYYNQSQIGGTTPVNQWVTTAGMQDGNFWFNRPPAAGEEDNIYVGTDCTDAEFTFWQGGIPGSALSQLLGTGGCLADSEAKIIGIAVGVGSQWPLPYHGFVDNVRMGFCDDENFTVGGSCEQNTLALDANFDFTPNTTVPEPSTYALMGAGLLALGVAARRRRQRSESRSESRTE